jgi:hypothetical protein
VRDGWTSAAGRVALGAVVLAVLVVPGRLLAAEHAMDHERVPSAGTVHVRATSGQTWEIAARVVAADDERLLLEVRSRVAVDSAAADISILPDVAVRLGARDRPSARRGGPGPAR